MSIAARITKDRSAAIKRPAMRSAPHLRITPISSPPANSILNRKPVCSCGGTCPRCNPESVIRPKLKIGAPNDIYEQEADRVADRVMQMPEPGVQRQPEEEEEEEIQTKPVAGEITPLIQRQEIPEVEEDEELIQTKTTGGKTPDVSAGIDSAVNSLKGGGRPLSGAERHFFEPRFGADFGKVRVHTDARAARIAGSISARAFTCGSEVVFGAGEYSSSTDSGRRLLAHELTHVAQQNRGLEIKRNRATNPNSPNVATHSPEFVQASNPGEHWIQREVIDGAAFGRPGDSELDRYRGSTLPYREATELMDCIRIMGEENAAYCRQEVLGEDPQPLPATPVTPSLPVCTPTALSRRDYLSRSGTSQSDFGLTRLNGTVTFPAVGFTRVRGGVKLMPTAAALPPITSVFTGAGNFIEGTAIVPRGGGGECPGGRFPLRWTITRGGARKIEEGEAEHCSDLQHAFNISIRRYADAVNTLANSNRMFRSRRQARRVLARRVGVAPADWINVFKCLACKTEERDHRHLHRPRARTRAPRLRNSCRFAEAIIRSSSLRRIGQLATPDLIKDCGESQANTAVINRDTRRCMNR